MRSGFVLLIAFVSLSSLHAQQTPLSGVIEGFTFDFPTKSVRPVIGSLGSATLGQPAFRGLTYGSFAVPEGVAWSGDGATAVLYSRTGNWIQTISGLPSAVNAGASISVASLGGSLSAAATDLHGGRVVIGITGAAAGVYQIANGANFVPLLPVLQPIALAFSEDGGTLYVLDGATNQLFAQNVADLSYQSWPLNGLVDPIAIRAAHDSENRAVVYVAGRNDRLLQAYDSSTHQVLASVPLNFPPNVIEPLGIGSFLLASRTTSDDILWSFRNTPQPLVYFVPAMPVRSEENHRK